MVEIFTFFSLLDYITFIIFIIEKLNSNTDMFTFIMLQFFCHDHNFFSKLVHATPFKFAHFVLKFKAAPYPDAKEERLLSPRKFHNPV